MDEVDIEEFDLVHDRLATLRNKRIKPGEPGHDEFRKTVKNFYTWLDGLRRPLMANLYKLHNKKRISANRYKIASVKPPKLSKFEQYTVNKGQFKTLLHAEPIFFRGVKQHVNQAES